ncbi:hypothetical protein, partial [Providencia rettgeri]|uniref:hypothetical protein n=1 Tax=Providencia rettgeri TaxID=587 RepID=UPI001FF76EE0
DISQYWDEIIVPNINNNGDFSLTEPESVNSLKGTYPTARLSTLLFSDPNFNKNSVLINNKSKIIDAIISYNLDKYKILDFKPEEDSNVVITGDCDEYKWIKSGNVFISLFNKSKELTINEAEEIWNNLVNSIYKWRPSYYNIIKSEIQNKIEAEALSFEVHLANDVYGQAAWLNEILKNTDTETRKEKIDFIFRNIAEELYFKLRENSDLNNFIDNVFTHFENVFNSKNFEDNIENNRLRFCAESMNLTYGDACNNDMYHALNMNTSSRNYREKYLTTGTILYNEENNEWYLCVSAACDMVPSQGNDAYHKRLKPHRLVQMLRLFECDATNAISNASHSKYIYVYEKSLTPPRKYYSVTNPTTNLPQIDYIVVLNHTTQKNVRSVQAVVLNANGNEVIPTTITLKLKSQLRTGYAERYQLIASQYGGRIGVDYFGINIIDE